MFIVFYSQLKEHLLKKTKLNSCLIKRGEMKSILLLFVLVNTTVFAGDWEILGHNQTRTELNGTDFNNSTYGKVFTSMKTRVQVSNSFDNIKFFVQIQDSRLLGQSGSSVSNLGNFDLFQGYLLIDDLIGNMDAQVGRFEISYGTERFLGGLGWHFVGRSFDGARLKFDFGGSNLDLFGAVLKEDDPYKATSQPGLQTVTNASSQSLYGAWYQLRSIANNKIDVFYYWDIDRTPGINLSRMNLGASWWSSFGNLNTTVEGAYQFGSSNDVDISAYILAVLIDYSINKNIFSIGADLISGTEVGTNNAINSFQANYGTNHKFYGLMDYFINIPLHTGGLGLNDIQAKYKRKLGNKLSAGLNFHHFMSNVPDANDDNVWGQELDLLLIWKFSQSLKITWGGSVFLPGQLMENRWSGNSDPAFWSFLMLTANVK